MGGRLGVGMGRRGGCMRGGGCGRLLGEGGWMVVWFEGGGGNGGFLGMERWGGWVV